jgi:O-antigen/teichoic acid export membrane protein
MAVTGMVAFADLGVGLGLMTRLAPCRVENDTDTARRYISSAYAMVTALALTACGFLWLFSSLVPWSAMFNTTEATAGDARLVALVCITAFLLNVPLSLVARVQYAYQQVVASNVWQACGSALSLPLALGAVAARLPPIAVIAAIAVSPVLVNIVNTMWTFGWRLKHVAPRFSSVGRRAIRDLLRLGGLFFVVILLMVLSDNAEPLIIAHAIGLGAVTTYAVPARVFAQLGMLVTTVNQPLWPMHGEALARGDLRWVRHTVRRMTVISASLALVPAVVLVVFGDDILAAWLPIRIDNRPLLLGLGCWWVLLAVICPRFMVQNAAGVVRPQLWGYLIYFVVSVPAKFAAVRWFGVQAVPYVAIGVYCATVLPAAIYGYQRALESGRRRKVQIDNAVE